VGEQRAKSRTRRQTGVNAPVKLALPARRHTGHRRPPPQADESPSDIRASARDAQASAFRPSRDRDRCARELRSTVTRSRKKRIPRLFAVSRFRSPSEFPHVSLIHAPGRPDGKLSVRRVRARYRTGIRYDSSVRFSRSPPTFEFPDKQPRSHARSEATMYTRKRTV
jgi:hypothetical protein